MKILIYIGKNFVPRIIQNIIKYCFFGTRFTFAQVKPLHPFTLASQKSHLDSSVWIDPNMTITGDIIMWRYSYVRSPNVKFIASFSNSIHIGNFCSIAWWVEIYASNDHNYNALTTYPPTATGIILWEEKDLWAPVYIWHDVWIWANSIILPGVHIWTGAVIGAWSIVTKNVPEYAIVAWVPASIIKYRFNQDTIEQLLASNWWDWDIEKIRQNYNLEFITSSHDINPHHHL